MARADTLAVTTSRPKARRIGPRSVPPALLLIEVSMDASDAGVSAPPERHKQTLSPRSCREAGQHRRGKAWYGMLTTVPVFKMLRTLRLTLAQKLTPTA